MRDVRLLRGVWPMSWHAEIIDYTDEDDWREKRRAGIGASDISAILQMSPYGTPFTVWADKVHGQEREATPEMERGKRREDVILEDFEAETGLHVGGRQLLVRHPKFPWAMATLDALAFDGPPADHPTVYGVEDLEHALGVVEAKHDGSFSRWAEIPDHHQLQVQWQLAVTGFEHGWLAVWHSGRPEIYEITADVGLQQMMLDRANDFRAKHITGGIGEPTPPEPDDHDATRRAISDLWGPDTADDDVTIELSKEMEADLEALQGVKLRLKELDKEKKRLEARLKVSMQEATVGTVDGEIALTWKAYHRDGYYVEAGDFRRLDIKDRRKRS